MVFINFDSFVLILKNTYVIFMFILILFSVK